MSGKIMETALARAAAQRGMSAASIVDKSHVLQYVPFNSQLKYSLSLIQESGRHTVVLVGAPDILIKHAALSDHDTQALEKQIHELALSGERVLGLASKEVHHHEEFSLSKDFYPAALSFDGLITFRDPIRRGSKTSLSVSVWPVSRLLS